MILAYMRMSRQEWPILDFPYYCGVSMFRGASIYQGVLKRYMMGNASQTSGQSIGAQSSQFGGKLVAFFAKCGLDDLKNGDPFDFTDENKLPPTLGFLEAKLSPRFYQHRKNLLRFMAQYCEAGRWRHHAEIAANTALGRRWTNTRCVEDLKVVARQLGLWNLFLPLDSDPKREFGAGLTNLEYALLCEELGRVAEIAPEACNCSAPDTGNMEVITRYGNKKQQDRWLRRLLEGEIRSCYAMTEPNVASSDARNIGISIKREGDEYVINGRKWWTSGACDPRCKVTVLMGKTNPDASTYRQQSMLLLPMDLPGITVLRPLTVFGRDDAPHGHAEVLFDNVRVKVEDSLLLGEGRGFEIAQGRLGPGRIHHCMRVIGLSERCLDIFKRRILTRTAFGKHLVKMANIQQHIAEARADIEQARLLTLQAAYMMDTVGNKVARKQIAMIKYVAPNMALKLIDRAIQAHGGAGVCDDFELAAIWAAIRTLRLADGPDEVHYMTAARIEMGTAKL